MSTVSSWIRTLLHWHPDESQAVTRAMRERAQALEAERFLIRRQREGGDPDGEGDPITGLIRGTYRPRRPPNGGTEP